MKPNIIIFNPDEMRADTLGHLGNPAAHTPFLDEMANRRRILPPRFLPEPRMRT